MPDPGQAGVRRRNEEEDITMRWKRFGALILAGVMVLSLAACGAGKPKVDYDTEFDALMDRIEDLAEKADYVSSVNIMVWQEVGPEEVAAVLAAMLKAEGASDLSSHSYDIKQALDTSSDAESWIYVEIYKGHYNALADDMEILKTDLKALKDACGSDHNDGIAALQKYFTKLQAYAEFATDPSGNLMNYRSNHEGFENDMAELKSAAEFDK